MHLFRYANNFPFGGNQTAIGIVTSLGLATNLKLCLDAGDSNSYAGGASWLDTAGSGYDFFRGTTSGADASDPTFNGTQGGRSSAEYFSVDGSDYFTYDTTNETWMNNIHKDSAQWTVAMWFYTTTLGTARGMMGTDNGDAANIGFNILASTTNSLRIRIGNGSGSRPLDWNPGTPNFVSGWNFLSVRLDETDGTNGLSLVINGSSETTSGTYTSPSASNATSTLQILAEGNNVLPARSGDRIGMFWMWEGTVLSTTNLSSIYTASRTRYGV